MSADSDNSMQIGRVLKEARTRAGLDIRTVEERTKIRVKYLRALEGEDWEALPNPAYAKGFLRTYAQLLGLDGEALTDEYRRQVSEPSNAGYPLGDQVLAGRYRAGQSPPRPRLGIVLAIAVLAALALLLVIGLSGDDDEGAGPERRQASERRSEPNTDRRAARRGETVSLEMSIKQPVEVCLVGGGGRALIDGQVLAAGTVEAYERERFELRFPKGFDGDQFRLELGGKRRLLPKAEGAAAYVITGPQRVRPAPRPGKDCP